MPRPIEPYVLSPWNFPVPTREGPFVAMRPEHAIYNVVTDLSALGPFGARHAPVDSSDLLYADYQITPDYCMPGRLGAGRAGAYRGRYLKGVGRTPLAANWNHPHDQKHATGHLAASSAIRELVVSWVLEAKGLAHRINPCEGVLLAPLDPVVRKHQDEARHSEGPIGADAFPCDRTLQAITLKGADFARFSNFVWLMNNMDLFTSRDGLVHFLFLFTRYLDPSRPLSLEEISPTRIASELETAIGRALGAFYDFFRAGVYWQFPQNNVTMDGRFHDLDFPQFVGGPFIGCTTMDAPRSMQLPRLDPIRVFGLNVIGYLYQVRIFFKLLRSRIALLPELDFSFSSDEREMLVQILAALDEAFPPDHPLNDPVAAGKKVLGWYRDHCDVSEQALPKLERVVMACTKWRLAQNLTELIDVDVEVFGTNPARPKESVAGFDGSRPTSEHLEEARFLNGLVAELDEITERDALFAMLDAAEKAIRAHVKAV